MKLYLLLLIVLFSSCQQPPKPKVNKPSVVVTVPKDWNKAKYPPKALACPWCNRALVGQ